MASLADDLAALPEWTLVPDAEPFALPIISPPSRGRPLSQSLLWYGNQGTVYRSYRQSIPTGGPDTWGPLSTGSWAVPIGAAETGDYMGWYGYSHHTQQPRAVARFVAPARRIGMTDESMSRYLVGAACDRPNGDAAGVYVEIGYGGMDPAPILRVTGDDSTIVDEVLWPYAYSPDTPVAVELNVTNTGAALTCWQLVFTVEGSTWDLLGTTTWVGTPPAGAWTNVFTYNGEISTYTGGVDAISPIWPTKAVLRGHAPALRQYPRSDGLAGSAARQMKGASRSRQGSLRQGWANTYL